jgi:hypothetical protein
MDMLDVKRGQTGAAALERGAVRTEERASAFCKTQTAAPTSP